MDYKFKTLYSEIGGQETIDKLVDAFYPRVYADPELRPLFEGDMEEIKRKQRMFLPQFLGGPALYSQEFGPPAMRERHLPFEVTPRTSTVLASLHERSFLLRLAFMIILQDLLFMIG